MPRSSGGATPLTLRDAAIANTRPMTAVSAGLVEVDGTTLHVERCGEGPLVLCVHGLGGGGYFFRALGQRLAARCCTLAIDLPGSGQSPPILSFSFEAAAALVVALVRRESPRALCLVGHSMGVIVCLEAMRRSPGLTASFVGVGGLPEPLPEPRTRLETRVDHVRTQGLRGVGEQAVAANFSARTRNDRPELTALFARLFETQDARAYADTAQALARWIAPPLPDLTGVSCFLVSGAEDRYAPPDAIAAFAHALPAGTAAEILPDCAHFPFLEQPAAFNALVERFLDGIPALAEDTRN
jgi:pimeloyl-ACP methyl ester carboxylesterase